MLLIKGAEVYAPEYLGKKDVLIAGEKIERIGEDLPEYEGCQVIDGTGRIVAPGFIDRHVHITGGGGEGSFHTQAPHGVTTVVGLLGTDGISRSTENLVAKAKALKEEGISAYCCCGAYGHPGPTITGSISRDIMFVDEIIGLKLAVSDHRAPNITVDELIRLGSDVRTAGMLSGKAGFVCLHMGGDDRALSPVFEALERTSIPVKTFQPTHVGRAKKLQEDAFKLAKMGGYVDFTASPPSGCAAIMKEFMAEAPDGSVTMSSDSNGSMPVWNEKNELIGIKAAESTGVYETMVALHLEQGLPLEEALKPCTVNVAKALNLYPRKGCLKPDSDADILVLDGDELKLYEMYAKGKKMMAEGKPIVKGYFEK